MAVVKRNNSYYVIRRDRSGKQKWISCGQGLDGRAKAYRIDDELKAAGAIRPYHQHPPVAEAPTFAQLANEYLKARQADLPEQSIYNLYRKLKSIILPEIGHLPATRITGRRLDQYVAARKKQSVYKRIGKKNQQRRVIARDRDGRPRTVKTTTIHRELSDIQTILNWAADPLRAYIAANPVAGYKKPRRDDDRITPPTTREYAAILTHLPEHAHRALAISFHTGVRPGRELYRICWHDIDWDQKTILIRSARKGGPSLRILPISDALLVLLERWHAIDAKEPGRRPEIVLYRGAPVASIKKAFAAAKAAAGITRRLRLYDFRHAFATDLINSGADTKSVSYFLGHSRPDTTSRIYQHTSMDALRRLINKRKGV